MQEPTQVDDCVGGSILCDEGGSGEDSGKAEKGVSLTDKKFEATGTRRLPAPCWIETDRIRSKKCDLMIGLRPGGTGLLFSWFHCTPAKPGINWAPTEMGRSQ
ncbi:protein of unknown function [Methylocaldum szegediense]|uniref:Uncharacterized protein n=1 Tax=Methylocaldum szegediense TaxID=73780 RepID=A0ABM9I7E4_9GAMM|nr:protein of unknown function [Methylocaldum szegediense]